MIAEMNNMPIVEVPRNAARFVYESEEERNEAVRNLAEEMVANNDLNGLTWLNDLQLSHEQSLMAEERLREMQAEDNQGNNG